MGYEVVWTMKFKQKSIRFLQIILYETGRKKRPDADLVLKFDPEARKDFLTGFRKRKLQRKQKAREDLAKAIKVCNYSK